SGSSQTSKESSLPPMQRRIGRLSGLRLSKSPILTRVQCYPFWLVVMAALATQSMSPNKSIKALAISTGRPEYIKRAATACTAFCEENRSPRSETSLDVFSQSVLLHSDERRDNSVKLNSERTT